MAAGMSIGSGLKSGRSTGSIVAFQFEAKPLPLPRRCLQAVAFSWDGQHSGAIVVADSGHHVLFADTTYRDAQQLAVTPRGRIVFVYNALWGSGLWQSKAVALCPVSADSWIDCLELVLDYRTAGRAAELIALQRAAFCCKIISRIK